jgi:hypothetical protein
MGSKVKMPPVEEVNTLQLEHSSPLVLAGARWASSIQILVHETEETSFG